MARLVLPVLLLVSAVAAQYLYLDTKLGILGPDSSWLTVGHAILPATFLVIALTNRRYGPTYAFAQVLMSGAVVTAAFLARPHELQGLLPAGVAPDMRVGGAFGVAFFLASFISIIVFDGARGPRWWAAPLLSALSAAIVFSSVFFPAAYGGTAVPWTHEMLVYGGLTVGAALASLLPYWILRGFVPPLSGFGGY